MKRSLLRMLALGTGLFLASHLYAQVPGDPALEGIPEQLPALEKDAAKVSSNLMEVYEKTQTGKTNRGKGNLPAFPDAIDLTQTREKGTMVLVDAAAKGDVEELRKELETLGMKVYSVYGRVISGLVPVQKIPELENLSTLQFVQPALKPFNNSGSVQSEGDKAQYSDIARRVAGVDGLGVKIGVLSDSYDNRNGAAKGISTGDLPGIGNPENHPKPVQVLSDNKSGGTDEGRAMLEIIHDVAPGAELAFHTANNGQADFANGIRRLADAGCKVIVDDVIYFAEPFFQDGIIAQAVDEVKKKGVAYFSSAGNSSRRSYESDYRASTVEPVGAGNGTAHNFSDPDSTPRYLQPVFIPKGGTFIASLQWDESFFSASGVGSRSDLDIYLLNNTGQIVAVGGNNNLNADPVEVFGYRNPATSTNTTFFLVIAKFAGPDPAKLKYVLYGDGAFFLTKPRIPGILSPTVVGHAKAQGATAVGAAFYQQTPPFGVNPPKIEGFSSKGGVAQYFDDKGNRLPHPWVRSKPEIVAPDGGNTTFFFQDSQADADTLPNFFGTSAAAPHAAAVAALMIEANKLNILGPDLIKLVMITSTIDMDDPGLAIPGFESPDFDKGFDFQTGFGFLRADEAVKKVTFNPFFVLPLAFTSLCSDNPAQARRWRVRNYNPFNVRVSYEVYGTSQKGELIAFPGDNIFLTDAIAGANTTIISWKDGFGCVRRNVKASGGAACNTSASARGEEQADDSAGEIQVLTAYPNPVAEGNFNILLLNAENQPVDVQVFDARGQKVHAQRKSLAENESEVNIPVNGLTSGMYFVRVGVGKQIQTVKMVKN
jgi:hypothetical protein